MTNKNGKQKSPSWDDIREATFNSGERLENRYECVGERADLVATIGHTVV